VDTFSLMNPPDDWKGYVSEGFTNIPGDIIRDIANYLDESGIRALEQVCRCTFAIIRPEWPSVRFYLAFWPSTVVEESRKQYSYSLCRALYKKRATNNPKMNPGHYFDGIIDQFPPSIYEANSYQWKAMSLKGGTNNYLLNQSWIEYLRSCTNLDYLILNDVYNMNLDINKYLIKLKSLLMGMRLKSVTIWNATVTLPLSVKEIVVYASEGNDQECHTQSSKQYLDRLSLKTWEGT
jgi:hypothetical protein